MSKKKYKSLQTGQEVTSAAYITELLCRNKANLDNKGAMAYKYWNTEKWKKFFRGQIASVNILLREYDDIPVIKALNTPFGRKCYSIRNKPLLNIIQQEQAKYENEKKKKSEEEVVEIPKITESKPSKPMRNKRKKNLFKEI